MDIVTIILQLENARMKLLAVDFRDKEMLLAASRKVDELVVEYYRAKYNLKACTP